MKVVIDISKNDYWLACNHPETLIGVYAQAIKNGTPLPKGHGRLGDLDALEKEMVNGIRAGNLEEGYEEYGNINNVDDCVDCVRYADTIIEADNGEQE